MPVKQAAFKHLRQTKKRTLQNFRLKRSLKHFIKNVRIAIGAQDKEKLQDYIQHVQKVLDKAAQARIIKKNNAARRKSRLMQQINVVLHS